MASTATAKAQGLYGASQDPLKDSFLENVCDMGPAVAEIEYTGIMEKPEALDGRFNVRAEAWPSSRGGIGNGSPYSVRPLAAAGIGLALGSVRLRKNR